MKIEISKISIDEDEDRAKANLCEWIDSFAAERILVADQVITNHAEQRIVNGDVILTFATSSVVQKVLEQAHHKGRQFRVIVIDSRPMLEGVSLARALVQLGIEVQYSLLSGLSHVIPRATKVLLGAHAMTNNGRLMSRIGTSLVAMIAYAEKLPILVLCETIKLTERVALDSVAMNELAPEDELVQDSSSPLSKWRSKENLQLLNPLYDITPAEYIDLVISEVRTVRPSSIPTLQLDITAGLES